MFSAEAERVACRIEENSDVLLELLRRDGRSERDCFCHRRVEVANLKVKMHHRALAARIRRPHRRPVVGRFLEHDVDMTFRYREYDRSRFLMSD